MKPIIAIYLPSLRGGGAERVTLTLTNAIAERGYSVDLILSTAIGPYLNDVSPMVNIIDLKQTRVITSLPGLVRYLLNRKPAVILSAMGHSNLIALLSRKLAKVKTRVVVSEHNNSMASIKNNKRDIKTWIVNYLNRRLYQSADEIIAVSNGVADSSAELLGLSREKIKVVYNPVVTDHLLKAAKADLMYSWITKDSNFLIIAAGRLTKQKDFPTLIRAFALLRAQIDARLVIIGEGGMRSDLEKLILELSLRDSVVLPGFVDNPFVVMKQANLFVLSSAWEGLPTVLIEAMACGTPVVSTECPSGPVEILENGKWGRLVPVGNVNALAQAMLDTLMETEHPDVFSRSAHFSVERSVDQYLDVMFSNSIE